MGSITAQVNTESIELAAAAAAAAASKPGAPANLILEIEVAGRRFCAALLDFYGNDSADINEISKYTFKVKAFNCGDQIETSLF